MTSAYDLWKQAGGGTSEYSSDEYRRLMLEHGLLVPLKPGEKPQGQPCGWPRAGYQCSTGGDACPGHPSKWLHCTPTGETLIAACKASRDEINVPHTCGLETRMYFQGNPHTHDGEQCVDWSHCTRTSDQQRNGGPSDHTGPVN